MKHEVRGNPDFGHVDVTLDPGETIWIESGAMAHMSANLDVKSHLMGGWLKAIWRKLVAGESLLVGEYTPRGGPAFMSLSPSMPGQVLHFALDGSRRLLMQPGAFLACTPGVQLDSVFGGLRAIFSGEGLFFLDVKGKGDLFANAYGAILEKDLDGTLVVDTGHVVAWDPSIEWSIRGMGNLFSTLFSGEGLVMEFKGRGKIYLQTRSEGCLVSWLSGYCRG